MRLRSLYESKKSAAFTFGRMNPPTKGHSRVIERILDQNGDHFVFLSHTVNKKNPLDFETKREIVESAYPDVLVGDHSVKNIFDALLFLEEKGYTDITLVVGADRVDELNNKLQKYNKQLYYFESINVVCAGDRTDGVSATKLRQHAENFEFAEFKREFMTEEYAAHAYNAVQKKLWT